MPPKATKQTFEDLYRLLEEKVGLLEQGGLSLDDSLSTYEEAVSLAKRCQEMLDGAELRITRLRESIAVSEAPSAYDASMLEDEEGVEA